MGARLPCWPSVTLVSLALWTLLQALLLAWLVGSTSCTRSSQEKLVSWLAVIAGTSMWQPHSGPCVSSSRLVGLSTRLATSSDICRGQCQPRRSTWFTTLRILLTRSGSALPSGPPPKTAPESPTECEACQVGHQLVLHTVAAPTRLGRGAACTKSMSADRQCWAAWP